MIVCLQLLDNFGNSLHEGEMVAEEGAPTTPSKEQRQSIGNNFEESKIIATEESQEDGSAARQETTES